MAKTKLAGRHSRELKSLLSLGAGRFERVRFGLSRSCRLVAVVGDMAKHQHSREALHRREGHRVMARYFLNRALIEPS